MNSLEILSKFGTLLIDFEALTEFYPSVLASLSFPSALSFFPLCPHFNSPWPGPILQVARLHLVSDVAALSKWKTRCTVYIHCKREEIRDLKMF